MLRVTLTHGFGLLPLRAADGKLHLTLWAADQEQVKRQVVFTLLVQTFGVHAQTPGGGTCDASVAGVSSCLSRNTFLPHSVKDLLISFSTTRGELMFSGSVLLAA